MGRKKKDQNDYVSCFASTQAIYPPFQMVIIVAVRKERGERGGRVSLNRPAPAFAERRANTQRMHKKRKMRGKKGSSFSIVFFFFLKQLTFPEPSAD